MVVCNREIGLKQFNIEILHKSIRKLHIDTLCNEKRHLSNEKQQQQQHLNKIIFQKLKNYEFLRPRSYFSSLQQMFIQVCERFKTSKRVIDSVTHQLLIVPWKTSLSVCGHDYIVCFSAIAKDYLETNKSFEWDLLRVCFVALPYLLPTSCDSPLVTVTEGQGFESNIRSSGSHL